MSPGWIFVKGVEHHHAVGAFVQHVCLEVCSSYRTCEDCDRCGEDKGFQKIHLASASWSPRDIERRPVTIWLVIDRIQISAAVFPGRGLGLLPKPRVNACIANKIDRQVLRIIDQRPDVTLLHNTERGGQGVGAGGIVGQN